MNSLIAGGLFLVGYVVAAVVASWLFQERQRLIEKQRRLKAKEDELESREREVRLSLAVLKVGLTKTTACVLNKAGYHIVRPAGGQATMSEISLN